jgi:hypothetical protein
MALVNHVGVQFFGSLLVSFGFWFWFAGCLLCEEGGGRSWAASGEDEGHEDGGPFVSYCRLQARYRLTMWYLGPYIEGKKVT